MPKFKIIPLVQLMFSDCPRTKAVAKQYNFKFNNIILYKMANGWLRLVVNWDSVNDGLMKYCSLDGTCHTDSEKYFGLEFPKIRYYYETYKGKRSKWKTEFGINVGIQSLNKKGEQEGELNYEPVFFNNLKYGVEAFFAPKGWEQYDKMKKII